MSGNMAASNFNIAHELFHKDDPIDKALGTLTMTRNLYMHFAIEHVFGHHKNVSTPIDPTSGDKNITVYQFIPSAIIGSIKSVWHLE
jgi:alkane 1-monooxygenase